MEKKMLEDTGKVIKSYTTRSGEKNLLGDVMKAS